MAVYICRELRMTRDGYSLNALEANGRVIMADALMTTIYPFIHEVMQPGDTYQEYYMSGRQSTVMDYEYMMDSKRREEAFARKL